MTIKSVKFQLVGEDYKKWLKNALIFLGPALLVFIPAIAKQIPAELGYGALVLYVLNVLTDLLTKWLKENTYKV